jgi:hypothetical protein
MLSAVQFGRSRTIDEEWLSCFFGSPWHDFIVLPEIVRLCYSACQAVPMTHRQV